MIVLYGGKWSGQFYSEKIFRNTSSDEKESFDVISMHLFNIENASLVRYIHANIIQHYCLKS